MILEFVLYGNCLSRFSNKAERLYDELAIMIEADDPTRKPQTT